MMKTTALLCSLVGFCAPKVAAFFVTFKAPRSSLMKAHPDDAALFDRIFLDDTDPRQLVVVDDDSKKTDPLQGYDLSTLNDNDTLLDRMVEEWHQQAAQLSKYEQSLFSDGYLSDLVVDDHEQKKKNKAANKMFMEKEMHRHDSLLHEIQHAMESDPDLDGITK